MTPREIAKSLLFEEESTTLDFKRDQYGFVVATDEEKSELLKDILAFTNAFRRADAYILIGVQEVKGGQSQVVGVASHIDDANLQQFVNSKTNRPVEFSYTPLELDGKQVGLIRIPLQQRPVYLIKDFGKLGKEVVYLRRGSSTATAKPDEIAQMGVPVDPALGRAPKLKASWVSGTYDEIQNSAARLSVVGLKIPERGDLPDYGRTALKGGWSVPTPFANAGFYRDVAEYIRLISGVAGLRVAVANTGDAVARNVKVILTIPVPHLVVFATSDLPAEPAAEPLPRLQTSGKSPDVTCTRLPEGWKCTASLGSVQAGDTVSSMDKLYMGSQSSCEIRIAAETYADEIPAPTREELTLAIDVTEKAASVQEVVNAAQEFL